MSAVVQLCAPSAPPVSEPRRDLEPLASQVWKAADMLSLQDPRDLAQHRLALTEAREKLDRAIALSKEDYHG